MDSSSTCRRIVLRGMRGEQVSALLAEPAAPVRATLVALHGAGMNARYFAAHPHAGASLVAVAASHGFAVLCIDRPGYGGSASGAPEGLPLRAQTDILAGALSWFAGRFDCGEGLGLLAHSFGGKVAIGLAGGEPLPVPLVSMDVSGCGHRLTRGSVAGGPMVGNNWGPLALYPLGTFRAVRDVVADVPAIEKAEVLRWPETFPGLAARIRIPVRLTFAEHEDWWCHDATDLAHLRRSFVNAPRVVVEEQPAAGHNISLGWAAKAYHLRALAFFEESLLLARHSNQQVPSVARGR